MADPAGRAAVTNRLRALRVCFKKQGKSQGHGLGACREIGVEGQEFVDGPMAGCSAAGREGEEHSFGREVMEETWSSGFAAGGTTNQPGVLWVQKPPAR